MITRNLEYTLENKSDWDRYKSLIPQIETIARQHYGGVVEGSRVFNDQTRIIRVTVFYPSERMMIRSLQKIERLMVKHDLQYEILNIIDPNKEKIINMIKKNESENPVPV
tara:strand:+ start:1179 stop:1508 length:330 start_codon:yes stop_codon:yes gene_type:complete